MNNEQMRRKWQRIRILVWLPIALALIAWTIRVDGWDFTRHKLIFLATGVSIAVVIAKLAGWM